MIDKKTVFVLGAGASCPYGYPSGARLRESICFNQGFWPSYSAYLRDNRSVQGVKEERLGKVDEFRQTFEKSSFKSIDVFIANNPKLAETGKYVIAYEIFRVEHESCFREYAKQLKDIYTARALSIERLTIDDLWRREAFQGGDWYFYIYNRLVEGLIGGNVLPNFSNGNLAFITFNYDRSLEQFLYEALRNSFTEVSEDDIVKTLKKLEIIHVYGQIAPLKWQNPNEYVDYKHPIDESLLQLIANNIRTIYEEKEHPELMEAQNLLKQAEQIFFLGFGYAPENMEILGLPLLISPSCLVYGTAFNSIEDERYRINSYVHDKRQKRGSYAALTKVESGDIDCLMLLRKYLT